MPKSEDALDQGRPRQKMGKAEKRAYAKEMFAQELLQPPKNPIKPLVLPKKPPHRRDEDEEKLIARVETRLASSGSGTLYVAGKPHYVGAMPKRAPDARALLAAIAALADPTYAPWHDLIRCVLET